jgi:GT2 family glycosyltransferase
MPQGTRISYADECPANETGGYLWSCNFAIRKNAFELLGGFDDNFPFPAMEDVDLHFRIKQSRLKIAFVPAALVYHPWESRTGWSRIRQRKASTIYYLNKHPTELRRLSPRHFLRGALIKATRDVVINARTFKGTHGLQLLRYAIGNLDLAVITSFLWLRSFFVTPLKRYLRA